MDKGKDNNPIYSHNTLEFVTVALEYCSFVEHAGEMEALEFVDKATKILPLLYLKASLLPVIEADDYYEPELSVTEDMYDSVRSRIAALLADKDTYLETFHADMAYSETAMLLFRRIWQMYIRTQEILLHCSDREMKKSCASR